MTEKKLQERLGAGWAIDCGKEHELARDVTEFLLELGYKHGMYASREIVNGKHSDWEYAHITESGCIEYYNAPYFLYDGDKIIPYDGDKIIPEDVIKSMLYEAVARMDEEFSAALDELMQ